MNERTNERTNEYNETNKTKQTIQDAHAKKVYVKLDAVHELMSLFISRQKWPEAIALADDPANRGKSITTSCVS